MIFVSVVVILFVFVGIQLNHLRKKTNKIERETAMNTPRQICGDDTLLLQTHFNARRTPVLRALLMYYGSAVSTDSLRAYAPTIESRFSIATHSLISLHIDTVLSLPLPNLNSIGPLSNGLEHDYDRMHQELPWITDQSMPRLWYYYHIDDCVGEESFLALKQKTSINPDSFDFIIVLTEAQFEGLAFSAGKVLVIEQPTEIAFEDRDGYRTDMNSRWMITDEVVHELGHGLGLRHECPGADHRFMDQDQATRYCERCSARENILSYCRDRSKVSENYAGAFSDCSLLYLRTVAIPAFLRGVRPNSNLAPSCH